MSDPSTIKDSSVTESSSSERTSRPSSPAASDTLSTITSSSTIVPADYQTSDETTDFFSSSQLVPPAVMSTTVSNNDQQVKIPELQSGNFSHWNKRFHFALQTRGLLKFLTEDSPPADADGLATYRRQQGRVMEIMVGSVDATNDSLIQLTDTPKVAYEKLTKAHGSSGGILAAATICEIATARLEPGQSLSEFITRTRNLHNQLAQYTTADSGISLSSKILAIFLCNGLGKEFEYITAPFFADLSTLKVQAVMDRLVLETAKRSSSGQTSSSVSAFKSSSTSATAGGSTASNRRIGPGPNDLCNLPNHRGLPHTNKNCFKQNGQKPRQ